MADRLYVPGVVGTTQGVRSPLTPPEGARPAPSARPVSVGGPEYDEQVPCTAVRSDGKPCKGTALPGTTTCFAHAPKYEA